ncbi:MAG: hypothetical protein ACRCVW_04875 [Brevinema sp.]
MKYIHFLFIIILTVGQSFAQQNGEITQTYIDKQRNITETFKHIPNGFIYKQTTPKKTFSYTVETNVNQATVAFTNIIETENITNEFFIMSGKIITPEKTIDIGLMEIILFPEIQLQNFITNTNILEITYKGIRAETAAIDTIIAKKITNESNNSDLLPIQITIESVPSNIVRIMYYFNKEGIAVRKEGFFGFSKKPKFSLLLEKDDIKK